MVKKLSSFRDVMTSTLAWRQNAVFFGLTVFYGAGVYAVAKVFSLEKFYKLGMYWGAIANILAINFGLILAYQLFRVVFLVRPARPLTMLWQNFLGYFRDRSFLLNVAIAAILIPFVIGAYSSFKMMIPGILPFHLDETFMKLDQWLHFGVHPWQLTHAVFSSATVTGIISMVYALWFIVIWLFTFYNVFLNRDLKGRMQFFITFILAWGVLGSLAALYMSSAGPVYYSAVTGLEDPYAALMEELKAMNATLEADDGFLRVWSLNVQDLLWQNFQQSGNGLGGGISAMPSMHLASTALATFQAYHIKRWFGFAMTGFLIVMLVGSAHLGWHYAIDGYVAIIATYALWRISRWALNRYWPGA